MQPQKNTLHMAVNPSLPASAVTHAVSGRFSVGLPDVMTETVVVRQNILTLYRHSTESCKTEGEVMQFVTEVPLNAPPLAAARCSPAGTATDFLALLFDDFHVSIVQFNPISLSFDTVALVQLDERDCLNERCTLDPILRVDPTGTYIAVLAKRTEFYLFPVLRKVSRDDAAALSGDANAAAAAAAAAVAESATTANAAASSEAAKPKISLDAWGDDDDDDDDASRADAPHVEPDTTQSDAHSPQDNSHSNDDQKVMSAGPAAALLSGDVLLVGAITKVSLMDLKSTLRNVRDFQFVESTGEPLIALLYERTPTWAGRVKLVEWRSKTVESHMLTCSVMWLRVTLANFPNTRLLPIGDVDNIPYDSTHLAAVPALQQVPSAVLCFSRSIIMHVSTQSGCGAYVNASGREQVGSARSQAMVFGPIHWADPTQKDLQTPIKVNLNFANCTAITLTSPAASAGLRMILITEDDGTVVEVLAHADGYVISHLSCRIIMTGCFCSCWAPLTSDCFFLGSYNGDSRVVAIGARTSLQILQTFVGLAPLQDVEVLDCTTPTIAAAEGSDSNNELDTSIEHSPYVDLFRNVSVDPLPTTLSDDEKRSRMDLAVCSGLGSAGSLCVLRHSIRNRVLQQEAVNATSVFFIENSALATRRKRARGDADDPASTAPAGASGGAAHLLMTGVNFTILFVVRSESIQHVHGTALNIRVRTVFAAELEWASAMVQVTECELRLVSADGKRKMQHILFHDFPELQNGVARAARVNSKERSLFIHLDSGVLARVAVEDAKAAVRPEVLAEKVTAFTVQQSTKELIVLQGTDLIVLDSNTSQVQCTFPNFALLPPVAVEEVPTPLANLSERLQREPLPVVTHMHMYERLSDSSPPGGPSSSVSCGNTGHTLVLLVSSGELLTYQFYPADSFGPRRLVKDAHHFLDLQPEREVIESVEAKKLRLQRERTSIGKDTEQVRHSSERLVPFRDINGCEGVYVCGQNPVFLMYHEAYGRLVPTRHQVSGTVRGFTPFSSGLVNAGYVYCCEGFVQFAVAQPFGVPIGHGWWMQRVPLGATPHQVVYSASAECVYVVASTPEPFAPAKAPFDVQLHIHYDDEGNKTITEENPVSLPALSMDSGSPVPMNARYEVRFISCVDWRCTDRCVLEQNEKVLSAQCLDLPRDTSMDVSPKAAVAPVCVLATAFPLGEDVTSRGRIVLLAAKHASGARQLRVLHSEPLKGPVTALTAIEGNVAVAVGSTIRVFRYDWRTRKLETLAMLYAGAYVTSLAAVREYLVYGDLYQSASLARFSAANHTLTVLGKDTNAFSAVHVNFFYREGAMGIAVTDDQRNMALLGYTPRVQDGRVLESLLSVEGEYRFASGSVVKMLRFRSLVSASSIAVYITNCGELGFLVPLGDQTNRTGQWVARRLQSDIPHVAGLTPRMFHGFVQDYPKYAMRGRERLLHAPLLQSLFRLDLRTRRAIAAAALTQFDRAVNIGVTVSADSALF